MEESRTVWIVEEQRLGGSGEVVQSWLEEYKNKAEALDDARGTWDHLTMDERYKTLVVVYQDIITISEDGGEDRLSWREGYTPIVTYKQLDRNELSSELIYMMESYYPEWDIESEWAEDVVNDPDGNLVSFIIDMEDHVNENPEDKAAGAILDKLYYLEACYIG